MDIGYQSGKWLYLLVNKGAEQQAGVWDHAGVILCRSGGVRPGRSISVGVKDSEVWHPKMPK